MGANRKLTKTLQVSYPIIQAGMAGGVTTPALVAAVSNAGGLGQIGAGYLSLAQLQQQIEGVRQLTTKPFGVNLFIPELVQVTEEEIATANERLAPIREAVGLTEEGHWEPTDETLFEAQIDLIVKEQVPICSFTFGVPAQAIVERLHHAGVTVIGTATTVAEARANEAVGVDAIVAQGSEAGGHRGTFLHEEALIGTMALVPQIVDAVQLPVIAAGGITDARTMLAAQLLGAEAVQMGTVFVPVVESGAHEVHKQAILQTKEDETVVTRAFSGRAARGIRNDFIAEMALYEEEILPYPVQNSLTKRIRTAAAEQENAAYMSLWCGQNTRGSLDVCATQLIEQLIEEAKSLMEQFVREGEAYK